MRTASFASPLSCLQHEYFRGYFFSKYCIAALGFQPIEVHSRTRSETDFTSGVCPECMKRLYPGYGDNP